MIRMVMVGDPMDMAEAARPCETFTSSVGSRLHQRCLDHILDGWIRCQCSTPASAYGIVTAYPRDPSGLGPQYRDNR
jgi:hypothetical protein